MLTTIDSSKQGNDEDPVDGDHRSLSFIVIYHHLPNHYLNQLKGKGMPSSLKGGFRHRKLPHISFGPNCWSKFVYKNRFSYLLLSCYQNFLPGWQFVDGTRINNDFSQTQGPSFGSDCAVSISSSRSSSTHLNYLARLFLVSFSVVSFRFRSSVALNVCVAMSLALVYVFSTLSRISLRYQFSSLYFSIIPLGRFFTDVYLLLVQSAHEEWQALADIAELIEPKGHTRQDFLDECRAGDLDGVVATYRTFESIDITGRFDEELIALLPESLRFICHNGR